MICWLTVVAIAAPSIPPAVQPHIGFLRGVPLGAELAPIDKHRPCAEEGPTRRKTFTYDAAGRIAEVRCWGCENMDKERLDQRVVYERDSDGYLTALRIFASIDVFERTGPPPAPEIHEEVTYKRDKAHRLIQIEAYQHYGGERDKWRFVWGDGERLDHVDTWIADAWQVEWRYTWAEGDLPTGLVTSSGDRVHMRQGFTWDKHGMLSRDESAGVDGTISMVIATERDADGRTLMQSYDYRGSSPNQKVQSHYDAAGRKIRDVTTGREDTLTEYKYDAEGGLLTGGGLCCFPRVFKYECSSK